ncbi:ricin-type beta-trefoil lectin domain protein [Streptomyces sp. NPDC054841]
MPELHRVGPDPAGEKADYATLSDAELTERIRAGAPPAYPATQELKRRHMPAVLTYARLCGRNHGSGYQLAVQAFGLAAQEACRGIEPRGNWRHHLLMLVQRVGLSWAAGGRRDRLEPDFVAWTDDTADTADIADTAGGADSADAAGIASGMPGTRRLRSEASSAMLTGFYRLPEVTRGVLWYAVVDEEPDATVATCLGIRPSMVAELRDKAHNAMRQAYIHAYLERGGDRKCLGFRRIIEAAARPEDRRRSEDLTIHLSECPRCTRLVTELARMADNPRAVIAEGLLRWGGSAYVARGTVPGLSDPVPARPDRSRSTAGRWGFTAFGRAPRSGGTPPEGARRPSPTVVLVAVAVAGAVVSGALLQSSSEDPVTARRAEEPPVQAAWPTPASPPPVLSASPTRKPSKKPSRSASPSTSAPAPEPPAPAPSPSAPPRPVPIAPGGGYVQVVNARSGLCLDIENGVMENRTDVVTARCNGARTQRWSLDSNGLLRSNADPDYCLDSRGDTDRGAGIWSCASVEGKNGLNLLFAADGSGAIHPMIAPDFALEPVDGSEGSSLGFDPADGESNQRWTAGTVPRA